jgi:hypothetical protein
MSTSLTTNAALSSTIELPAEIRNHIHGYMATSGELTAYSGYLLASKETYREVSSIFLAKLNETLVTVESNWQEWQENASTKLLIDKPKTLAEAKTISVGLPKSYLIGHDYHLRPVLLDQPNRLLLSPPDHLPSPLNALLRVECSTLKLYLYEDPDFTRENFEIALARDASYWLNSRLRKLCFELEVLANTRGPFMGMWGTTAKHVKAPNEPGLLKANTLIFEWGVLSNSPDAQNRYEQSFVGEFLVQERCQRWWRYQLYRADQVFDDTVGVVQCWPGDLVDSGVENRTPTIGIVLDKIERREERNPLTHLFAKFFYAKNPTEFFLMIDPRFP